LDEFKLGKTPITRSGFNVRKLALGKLNSKLFSVHINSPASNAYLRDLTNVTDKLSLYPAFDSMNFSIDRLAKKAASEFYVYNTGEVAMWVAIEVHVPELQLFNGYVSASPDTWDWKHWELSLWDVPAGAYVKVLAPETGVNANYIWNSALSKYLDGSTFFNINNEGAPWWSMNSAAACTDGVFGETKGRKYIGMANQTITYLRCRCKHRLGFVVKISAGTGIRSKIEVFYD
jgi:hypothetical protein